MLRSVRARVHAEVTKVVVGQDAALDALLISLAVGGHALLGGGAHFAPELGSVYVRFGKNKEAIKAFIQSRPAEGIPGRRSMPQFHFSDADLDAIAEFLKYSSEINTAGWPPNQQG